MGDATLLELIYGKGAHVDPVACIEDISAALAARTVAGYPHSIWQIVEHISYWTEYELANIAGENPHYPDKAIESWPQHPNPADVHSVDGHSVDGHLFEEQWQASVHRFANLLAQLARIAQSDGATLERKIFSAALPQAPRESTVQTVLWQIAAHNSYHVGQIALLRRQFGAWPPRRGGDTW
jgi:uncharacterized damage-inducible protein DinB